MTQTLSLVRRPSGPPTRFLARVAESVRSYWVGPFLSSDPALAGIFGGGSKTIAGPSVSPITAFMCAAFWDGVNQLSGDIAKLPLNLLKRRPDGGSDHFVDSRTYKLLKYSPNPETRSLVFRRTLMVHALVYGNGYAEIERDGNGRPFALWNLHPNRVTPFYDLGKTREGRRDPLRYRVDGDVFEASDILHIQGLGDDGVMGFNTVQFAREALGLALASGQFAAAFFGNGTRFGGVLSSDDDLDPDQAKEIRERIEEMHAKADKAFRLLVLGAGFKFTEAGVKPNEAQMKEVRDQQIAEVARYLNMPLHKLKELSRSTNNNIEHQDLEYFKGPILTWVTTIEEELNAKLIPALELGHQYFKHNTNAFLRGDIKSRYDALGIARDKGIISADEWRELEDMNPQPNGQGKTYLVQQAMVPASKLEALVDAQITKATRPTPTPAPASDDRGLVARLEAAEQAADEARLTAQAERDRRVALEATGTATAEELTRAVTAERESFARAEAQTAIALQVQLDADAARRAEEHARALALEADHARQAAEEAVRTTQAQAERDLAEAQDAIQAAMGRAEQAESARLGLIDEQRAASDAAAEARGRLEAEQQAAHAQIVALEAAYQAVTAKLTEETSARATVEAERERLTQAWQDAVIKAEALEAQGQAAATAEAARVAALAADLHAATQQAEAAGADLVAATQREAAMRDALAAKDAQHQTAVDTLTAHVEEARAAVMQAQADVQAVRAADQAGVAATIAAHRDLFVDVMRRMIERETDRARGKAQYPEKLRQWLDTFYDGHAELMRASLLPAMKIHLAFVRSDEPPMEATRRMVDTHIRESKRQLALVLEGDAEAIAASVPQLLYRWEAERVTAIGDQIMQKELDYARQ